MTALLLSLLVCSPVSRPAPRASSAAFSDPSLSEDEVNARVVTYLGTVDRPTPPAQWQALGTRAAPLLQQIASDPTALPTRRAKAIAGLAAIAPSGAPELMLQLAGSELEPRAVRLAAVRGAAMALPEAQVGPSLQPILENAGDLHVRRAAAVALSEHGGCEMVRARAARESNALVLQRALSFCPK